MSQQVNVWQGEFGDAYTDRNQVDWRTRTPAFRTMLQDLVIHNVLEVGCNRGHNLLNMATILSDNTDTVNSDIIGLEPNRQALELARGSSTKITALHGYGSDIPFKANHFDLVFTAGVLIHIALDDLPGVLAEIVRVSRRYILAVEYFAEEETTIHYRGHDNLLWKRNFLRHYQTQFPDLELIREGYWDAEDGFDRANWWLLEKTQAGGVS